MTKNRTRVEIVANILSIIAGEPKKTNIMYGANLSYTLLQKYLEKLIEAGLVSYLDNLRVYQLTNKGETYLKTYAEYEKLKDFSQSNELKLNEKVSILNEIIEASRTNQIRGNLGNSRSKYAFL